MITGCIDHGKADRQNFPDFILTRMRARDSPGKKDSYTLISDIRAYLPKNRIYQRKLNMEPPDMSRDNAFFRIDLPSGTKLPEGPILSGYFYESEEPQL